MSNLNSTGGNNNTTTPVVDTSDSKLTENQGVDKIAENAESRQEGDVQVVKPLTVLSKEQMGRKEDGVVGQTWLKKSNITPEVLQLGVSAILTDAESIAGLTFTTLVYVDSTLTNPPEFDGVKELIIMTDGKSSVVDVKGQKFNLYGCITHLDNYGERISALRPFDFKQESLTSAGFSCAVWLRPETVVRLSDVIELQFPTTQTLGPTNQFRTGPIVPGVKHISIAVFVTRNTKDDVVASQNVDVPPDKQTKSNYDALSKLLTNK